MSVLTYAHEIHPPRINTNRNDFYIFLARGQFQTFNDIAIEFINIPIEMSVYFNQMVRETIDFFHF